MGRIKRRDEFKDEQLKPLLKLMSQFPAPAKEYNDFGIRYPIEFLNSVGISIIFLPLEMMAEFVDAVTKTHVDENNPAYENQVTNEIKGYAGNFENIIKHSNATSIGNLAYILLNSKNEELKSLANEILEATHTYQVEAAKIFISKLSTKHGVN